MAIRSEGTATKERKHQIFKRKKILTISSSLHCYGTSSTTNEQAMQAIVPFLHTVPPPNRAYFGLISVSPELWYHTKCGLAWYTRPVHLAHSKDFRKPLTSNSSQNDSSLFPFAVHNNSNPCFNDSL